MRTWTCRTGSQRRIRTPIACLRKRTGGKPGARIRALPVTGRPLSRNQDRLAGRLAVSGLTGLHRRNLFARNRPETRCSCPFDVKFPTRL